ncbi:hypothetical protein OPT61_g9657 [Boeremia exigua]|uniref:Uncharacterized protein n=1 Tax=Boeremia exigua TaxID=749465 RepID=A0ACC2HTZ1_9PLEO|nr:hypothetical protein OPT61_g9657 [Boeremia exigua]
MLAKSSRTLRSISRQRIARPTKLHQPNQDNGIRNGIRNEKDFAVPERLRKRSFCIRRRQPEERCAHVQTAALCVRGDTVFTDSVTWLCVAPVRQGDSGRDGILRKERPPRHWSERPNPGVPSSRYDSQSTAPLASTRTAVLLASV